MGSLPDVGISLVQEVDNDRNRRSEPERNEGATGHPDHGGLGVREERDELRSELPAEQTAGGAPSDGRNESGGFVT